jgi:hypothetical protein
MTPFYEERAGLRFGGTAPASTKVTSVSAHCGDVIDHGGESHLDKSSRGPRGSSKANMVIPIKECFQQEVNRVDC